MLRRLLLIFWLGLWASLAIAQSSPKPSAKDLCPVCGMLVSKYPNWIAVVTWKDGHSHFFDGAKDMFKFLQNLEKYAPGHRATDIARVLVTDFYSLERIDATKAFFVTGSDVLGPMGHELIPLVSMPDAEDFLKDHKGRKILKYQTVDAALIKTLD